VTVRAALIVTVQPPLPVQAPLQLVKVEPAAGAAVQGHHGVVVEREGAGRAAVDAGRGARHSAGAGTGLFTVRTKVGTVKLAVTVLAAFIVTTQVPVPLQLPPVHP